MNVSASHLRSLAEDTLRFTIHFFHLIQQSALHIYHSTLLLSPASSTFHSRSLGEKTKVKGFYGRPDAWGIVVRTITASSKRYTCMTTFGNKVAAACDDGAMDIYDSVTGVLRLSLRLADPAQAIQGSPDGSILFCAHKTPSITVWDMQTGGLIRTFDLEHSAEDIAISLRGRYLASRFYNLSVKVRDVANKMEGVVVWTRSTVTGFCWLDPEERFVVSTRTLVRIWNIVTGTLLHSYMAHYPISRMIYPQKFDQLAVMTSSASKSTITVLNPQTSAAASHSIQQTLSCFTFSQTTEELVFGMKADGLQLFNLSTQRWRQIEYPGMVNSVSSLKNGTMVANSAGSGIQLLSLAGGHSPSQQPTISALTVEAFDEGKIIAIFPTTRDHITLLDSTTMSRLLRIPAQNSPLTPAHNTTILCASHEHLMTVYCFKEENTKFMQLWGFRAEAPRWTVKIDEVPEIGRFSPNAVWLVTIHTVGDLSCFFVWNPKDGQLFRQLESTPLPHPLDIDFIHDTEFVLYHGKASSRCHINRWSEGISVWKYLTQSERPGKKQYTVNETCEWVISDSERICWIPPGYIGSVQPNYYWIGHLLVMFGQDGKLRMLSFSQPP